MKNANNFTIPKPQSQDFEVGIISGLNTSFHATFATLSKVRKFPSIWNYFFSFWGILSNIYFGDFFDNFWMKINSFCLCFFALYVSWLSDCAWFFTIFAITSCWHQWEEAEEKVSFLNRVADTLAISHNARTVEPRLRNSRFKRNPGLRDFLSVTEESLKSGFDCILKWRVAP